MNHKPQNPSVTDYHFRHVKKHQTSWIIVLLFVVTLTFNREASGSEDVIIHVSSKGQDAWSGQLAEPNQDRTDGPVASLNRAIEALRQLGADGRIGDRPRVIRIQGGTYRLGESLSLTQEDSGTAQAPLVIESVPGAEVRLSGGRRITNWKTVTDPEVVKRLSEPARDRVRVANLETPGKADLGQMRRRGFAVPVRPAGLEVFVNDRPARLAEYPNRDWLTIAEPPDGADGGRFRFEGQTPFLQDMPKNTWIHGYWTHDWADSYEQVAQARLNPEGGEVTTVAPHGVYGYQLGQRFRFLNALELIDQPGEWFLDRSTSQLYLWPPQRDPDLEWVVGSQLDRLITIEGASHVKLVGLGLTDVRGDAIVIRDGSHVTISGCAIRNVGNRAIRVEGGSDHRVESCDIADCGDGGIQISGGDRQRLKPANHEVFDCHLTRFSRWCRTYRPAIQVSGVGTLIHANRIHDAPHSAIQFSGNNHVFEYNQIFNICYDSGDVGAIYAGRDLTMRGHVIRHNFLHDIRGPGKYGAMGVYLDDGFCGVTITGNVCLRASKGVFLGGGDDNRVVGNLFLDCEPAIHLDARGLTWMQDRYQQPDGDLIQKLGQVPYDRQPYRSRYPSLATILETDPRVPRGNRFLHNVNVDGSWLEIDPRAEATTMIKGNLIDAARELVIDSEDPFRLRTIVDDPRSDETDPLLELVPDFQPIPFQRIGLADGPNRQRIPPSLRLEVKATVAKP